MSRSLPTRWVISSHCLAVRWSHQMMDRRSTRPCLSSITRPCIWPEIPRPLMSRGSTPPCWMTDCKVSQEACHQSRGSCSAQPLRSWYMGYSTVALAMTFPSRSKSTVFVPLVPRSMPIKYSITIPSFPRSPRGETSIQLTFYFPRFSPACQGRARFFRRAPFLHFGLAGTGKSCYPNNREAATPNPGKGPGNFQTGGAEYGDL